MVASPKQACAASLGSDAVPATSSPIFYMDPAGSDPEQEASLPS